MITMRGSMARMFLAVLLAWSASIPASAEEWEVEIVASTPDGAENSLHFGQKPDATDGYDSRYEVRAMLGGDIEASFPHAEWDVLAEHFWRDIKAADQTKSWVFEVNTALSGTETTLKWDPLKLPEGYVVELTDMAQHTVIDMTSQSEHHFSTYGGPRQFTINTKAPDMAVFLKSPSGLEAAWGENNAVIHLIWTDNSEGESGFRLERKVPGEQWTLVALLDANTTAYSDDTLAPLTGGKKNNEVIFLYRVKAYNSLTESEFSNTKPIK
ncbi:hypothetical protein [Motiliproteus sp. SC1-56]|uniref:hypothetical protein n=1 Tax=Motiliproteus sp. SC1-56 TaxID=2799565 RepID=UPI001A8E6FDD|nr:hypothetical protein [Motiliproteus sp. SC1-56]